MAWGGKREGAGKKKGSKAAHTLQAEVYRKHLIREIIKKRKPLAKALIDKGLAGDVPALKEIHERSLGKVMESLKLDYGAEAIEALKSQLKDLINVHRGKKDLS